MTIDEAIEHAREVAYEKSDCWKNCENYDKSCTQCEQENEQLAEWLEELKMLRELKNEHRKIGNIEGFNKGYCKAENDYHAQSEKDRQSSYDCGFVEGYNKEIDDLIAKCENAKFAESDEIVLSDIHQGVNSGLSMAIHFAEQLKAGGIDDKKRV